MELSNRIKNISPSLTLKITALSNELKSQGKNVIGFGAGEPDFGTPEFIKDAAKEALDKGLTKYTPASGTKELKQAVCGRYKRLYNMDITPEQVVISNGAKHSLFNAFMAILNPGDEVLLPSPYWLTYPELVLMADGVNVFVPTTQETDFKVTPELLREYITPKTKAVILNSPSNPCGCVYSKDELAGIASLAVEKGLYIVSDEIYDELTYDGEYISVASLDPKIADQTILINGMSKTYAMTGWRIGYTISNAPLAKAMGSYQSHATSNPNSIAQYASVAALNGPQDFIGEMKAKFDCRRKLMVGLINEIPYLSARLPQGAFYVFVNIQGAIGKSFEGKTISGSLDFTEYLLESTLTAVVPGIAFGDDNYIRLSYATSEENIKTGISRIAQFCEKLV